MTQTSGAGARGRVVPLIKSGVPVRTNPLRRRRSRSLSGRPCKGVASATAAERLHREWSEDDGQGIVLNRRQGRNELDRKSKQHPVSHGKRLGGPALGVGGSTGGGFAVMSGRAGRFAVAGWGLGWPPWRPSRRGHGARNIPPSRKLGADIGNR
ncbi:MAG: hypothetical protein ACK5PF_03420 [bacterium]